jgi:uncharacterized integral membrane protein
VLVIFVLSNTQPVTIGFWPSDVRWDMPLSIAVLPAAGPWGASATRMVL